MKIADIAEIPQIMTEKLANCEVLAHNVGKNFISVKTEPTVCYVYAIATEELAKYFWGEDKILHKEIVGV